MQLSDSITGIKGIGSKTAESFGKLGIYTIKDLILAYPRNYLSYREPVLLSEAEEGERTVLYLQIVSHVEVKKVRSLTLTTLSARDASGSIRLTWFNSPFLRNVFHKGDSYIFVGTVKYKNNMRVMEMPEYYSEGKYAGMTKKLQPVYSLTAGLSNKTFQKSVGAVSDLILGLPDYMPEPLLQKYGLMARGEALYNMHFPQNMEVLKDAIRRMAFDEFLGFLLEVRKIREENVTVENTHRISEDAAMALNQFIQRLPYSLTKGQTEAVADIQKDMGSDHVMNRLIQGDVGSGKTIVAAAALYLAAVSGYQGALMVPTEVLALQHYQDFCEMFTPLGIRVGYLVGSTPLKEKRHIYEALKNHQLDIIIGTHALIQDKVEYHNLGLVVTDEQHRFGVKQRQRLSEKGEMPHVLIMSATPIPRTLAIILYADMDISVIKELPAGRKPIKNCVVGTEYRNTAYGFIKRQVQEGHQAYVICPMVEESEALEAENVIDYADTLKQALGPGISVSYLHGKMKEGEKSDILQDFVQGRIQVLVSTTVIEVGINNPNATLMMIENAERFGLAQLHQLRGRVGRGDAQSYCIFINAKKSKESMERLQVLENSNDGFYIASEDLKLRGPGDFFGIRQSGDIMFQLADIYNHADMLKTAQEVAINYGDSLQAESVGNVPITTL